MTPFHSARCCWYMNGGTNWVLRNNAVWGSTSTYVEASQIMAAGG